MTMGNSLPRMMQVGVRDIIWQLRYAHVDAARQFFVVRDVDCTQDSDRRQSSAVESLPQP